MGLLERMTVCRDREFYYYDTRDAFEAEELARQLKGMIDEEKQRHQKSGIVFLCIGTDRSTGDSLGPLIGYKLNRLTMDRVVVLGTLDRPVHAMNLEEYVLVLKEYYADYIVVAVDASVGNKENIGCITLGKGALKPGLGVSKDLRAVGDIFITGVVGSCTRFDPLMLQSVRLSVVMRMADCISNSIYLVEKFLDNRATV